MEKTWILNEQFDSGRMDERLEWYCEPGTWKLSSSGLMLETDEQTDYWQRTHYGFQVDNGHFLFKRTNRNFRMTAKVEALPQSKYDQAGLMIRYSEEVWVKTSLEYIPDGQSKLGAVVTNRGYSDWSTQLVDWAAVPLYFRISKIGQNVYVDYSWNGESWTQIRIAHLDVPEHSSIQAGIYACSPQGKGMKVHVHNLTIEELGSDPEQAYL
ncbi:DUF1349 domain-containing protein [Paenibacillus protaetiae]|uniref:DUF1349 domain-containing protein n=1 Tax=Paenibacillus protaetiae TaxID=2509456 RepID=A0A4P6EX00_9BACL|nr:DUF1349 domain-containing protein [Paenibacillus protaetiae]QAY67920.1 DUF1349 domain-containing protein [Paenibacillus protaetiae]